MLASSSLPIVLFCLLSVNAHSRRSIDLIAAHGLISDSRLPREITPNRYDLELEPHPSEGTFDGRVRINVTWQESADKITLHADEDLEIYKIVVTQHAQDDETEKTASTPLPPTEMRVMKTEKVAKKPFYVLHLEKTWHRGTQAVVDLTFKGRMYNDTSEGMFRSSYVEPLTKSQKWYVATHFRPNLARKVFPCFDEPAFKAPFTISVVRHKSMVAVSNERLVNTKPREGKSDWFVDTFEETPPISTFSVGIVVSDFSNTYANYTADAINGEPSRVIEIKVWARPDFINALVNVTDKVQKAITIMRSFWNMDFPASKLDLVALPNYQATRPADCWGLLFFKESELSGRGSWHITQELAYQWLGALATPFWWSDAHINNALARYVTAHTTIKMGTNESFNNWPMTMLYSIYYEFSKRYPHGKSTAIKQDSTSAKTELVFRMLNYTLGEKTFVRALQDFMADRKFKSFFSDDIWNSLTQQARVNSVLHDSLSVNAIAASWITKDRLPVVTVTRNYDEDSATISQRVYLRERPHDVPDQEKFVWLIPIVLIRQDSLNFDNLKPEVWLRQKESILADLPDSDQFIIMNPEEIGPFPVNYDTKNWNMLAQYLCTENRVKIPVITRAKLLHDAWNLAYAGDLSFAVALNMTLFLKQEREYLAWDPVFTLIDHIGRHIDSSDVHKKFQTYVRLLLTPLYEELGDEPKEGESEGQAHLRSSSKVFLCQAGYKPCIEEAQTAFKKWMENENPDEGNPVSNQYICPVFKWGTNQEWEFGLQRVINFPVNRKQSERTYLLKTLAGCPNEAEKIERLLNITILEQNGNFTDNDVYLIFSMLTGSANGYTTLFNFLKKNWDTIKVRFDGKLHLWNSLITSATSVFKTQEGLDMVSELYVQRQSEFGTADFVIEKALKNIKEETKWSNDNLPVIEKWLDEYLRANNVTK